ncbi:MAG: hypothetical protein ACREPB_10815 [Arenimonas sp.]
MNTQPPRQHEAFSDEERELARVVRALPGGEPPAALDALILKAATDAVASSHPQKNSRWKKGLLGTSALWIGTAAASVLTIGIGWQVFQSMGAPIYELPDSENVMSRQEVDSNDKDESITVDMIPAREPAPTSPAPQIAEAESADMAAANDAAASVATAKPKPDLMKSEMRASEALARQQMADASLAKKANDKADMRRDQPVEQDSFAEIAGVVASAPAPPPPSPIVAAAPQAASASAGYAERKEMESVTVTGSRLRRADSEETGVKVFTRNEITRLAISEDAKLRPDLWLDAIKDRMERDDIEGAKASLKLYRETHPKLRIPEELKPLLK